MILRSTKVGEFLVYKGLSRRNCGNLEKSSIMLLNLSTHNSYRVFSLSCTYDIYTQQLKWYFWIPVVQGISSLGLQDWGVCFQPPSPSSSPIPDHFRLTGLFPVSQTHWTESFAGLGHLHMPSPLENTSTFRLLPHYHFLKKSLSRRPIQRRITLAPLVISINAHYFRFSDKIGCSCRVVSW